MSNELSSRDELCRSLVDACATGELSQVNELFDQSQRHDARLVPTPQYLLQVAAKNGQAEDPYIPRGVAFNDIPAKWRIFEDGVIHCALEGSNSLEVFRVFLEYGMTPDYNLDRAISPFARAVASNQVDLAAFFLSRGAKPTGRYIIENDTYLGTAARRPSSDMLELLIEHGSKLEGSQALAQAVQYGQIDNVEILLELGVDINEVYTTMDYVARETKNLGSALHFAVTGGPLDIERQYLEAEVVHFLLGRGAKADLTDGEGRTPLKVAVQECKYDVVQVFKNHGIEK